MSYGKKVNSPIRIEVSGGGGGSGGDGVTVYANVAALQSALPNGAAHPVWVNAEKKWFYWNGAITEPVTPTIPATPSAPTATAGDGQVSLSWAAVSGATSYRVYRDGTLIASPTNTTYTDTGRTNGTAYSYTVAAVNSAGESAQSSATSATPQAPSGATHYLAMNGTNNAVKVPSISFTEVVLDCYVEHKTGVIQQYINVANGAPFGAFRRLATNLDNWQSDYLAIYIDGVSKTNDTAFVPSNQRLTIRAVMKQAFTDDPTIFANTIASSEFMQGRIYDVKFYNGASLVAHYNMSTQSLNDQSGNGKHATMNGTATYVAI